MAVKCIHGNIRQLSLLVVTLLLIFVLAAGHATAQETDVTTQTEFDAQVVAQLPDPGLLPDSPLYVVEGLWERIRLTFTFGAEARAEFLAKLMDRRTAEMVAMAEKGDEDAGEPSARSQARLSQQAYAALQTAVLAADVEAEPSVRLEAAFTAVDGATARAQHVLTALYSRVGPEATAGLDVALEAQIAGQQALLDVLVDLAANGALHPRFSEMAASLGARLGLELAPGLRLVP